MTLDDMTTQLLGMFDIPLATAQAYVNEAYRSFVADSEWSTQYLTISTTPGVQDYPVPARTTSIEDVRVNGAEYIRVGEWDIIALRAGQAMLPVGIPGAFAPASNPTEGGGDLVTLYPTPAAAVPFALKLVTVPPDLTTGQSPAIQVDLHGAILNGAIAIAYSRVDELAYMAQYFDGQFQAGIQKARARKIRRSSGHGPFRARVAGHDF